MRFAVNVVICSKNRKEVEVWRGEGTRWREEGRTSVRSGGKVNLTGKVLLNYCSTLRKL